MGVPISPPWGAGTILEHSIVPHELVSAPLLYFILFTAASVAERLELLMTKQKGKKKGSDLRFFRQKREMSKANLSFFPRKILRIRHSRDS